jgi:16S rRNA (guanine527-N7)-methyltransferase
MAEDNSINIITKYFPGITERQKEQFLQMKVLYEHWNAQINVISRKDMDHFYVHHVLHSLAIAKVLTFRPGTTVLDVGTGGGFPGIPLAVMFPEVRFHLVDSIGKKIKVVKEVAAALELTNAVAEQRRVEELDHTYDFVVSRAVAPWADIFRWTAKLIHTKGKNSLPNGWLLLKGGDLKDELQAVRRKVHHHEIKAMFDDEFFETKKVLYISV